MSTTDLAVRLTIAAMWSLCIIIPVCALGELIAWPKFVGPFAVTSTFAVAFALTCSLFNRRL